MLLQRRLFFSTRVQHVISQRRRLQFKTFAVKNASGRSGRGRRVLHRCLQRKVYTVAVVAVKENCFFVLPVGCSLFFVNSFVCVVKRLLHWNDVDPVTLREAYSDQNASEEFRNLNPLECMLELFRTLTDVRLVQISRKDKSDRSSVVVRLE
ncbi:hypothetical protein Tco_0139174 [Tanacetum coccineum]